MTPAQKVQVRISEVRQRLNELVGQDRLSEEEQAEADTLGGEYRELETKLRASLVADGGAGTGGETRAAPGELLGAGRTKELHHGGREGQDRRRRGGGAEGGSVRRQGPRRPDTLGRPTSPASGGAGRRRDHGPRRQSGAGRRRSFRECSRRLPRCFWE